ncbi:MAG: 1-(5-phosphoribosyl)-5-[(5-phosphoribosylamino)methylideneamino] imidazole-4-carboxamide isomerase [Gammaproteobacteria bacterium]|nr:1-(5-phosphoribosyl)-5-[(5-phosphoribosylamino)methylideneamino] imidazole-4-carboxamide isomerase [Gammaproteobacteria bacterium]
MRAKPNLAGPKEGSVELIPSIDLMGGQVVRLRRGRFDDATFYPETPLGLARKWAGLGARALHVVDLDGARSGRRENAEAIAQVAHGTSLKVQAGGGIRDDDTLKLVFASGARRAVAGSALAENKQRARRWVKEYGADRLVAALDVRSGSSPDPEVLTHGWTRGSGLSLWTLLDHLLEQGVIWFLCTDVGRDGMLSGPNADLYARCTRHAPQASFIASGGVSQADDLRALADTGVAAAVSGKALLDGRISDKEAEACWRGE